MEILKKIAKLIDVKSIISLSLTFVFCYLALSKFVSQEIFISVYSIIIGFYFGTQYAKTRTKTESIENDTKIINEEEK